MLKQLDHVNVRTGNLAGMIEWYDRVLGAKSGPRPDFPFGGAWLYVKSQPVIHLVDTETTENPGENVQLEHMAFQGEDYQHFIDHLNAERIEFSELKLDDPVARMTQVHVRDVDGNHIHIDFHTTATD